MLSHTLLNEMLRFYFFKKKKVRIKLNKRETPFFGIRQATENGVVTLGMSLNKNVYLPSRLPAGCHCLCCSFSL